MKTDAHPVNKDETFIKYGERHYVRPKHTHNRLPAFCVHCAYYLPWPKPKLHHDGECTSKCHNKEGGASFHHNTHGNDWTTWNNECKWFWPKEGEYDENSLFKEEPAESEGKG